MTRFEKVIDILDQAIGGPMANIGVHGAFWRGLTRDQFVSRKVVGRPLLIVNNGSESNLIRALKGESPFGSDLPNPPAGAMIPRMPDALPPVPDRDVAFIEQWINEGCPEDPFTPNHQRDTANGLVAQTSNAELAMNWQPTNAPKASSRYDDVFFNDPSQGWAVNSNGQVLYTADGGVSWQEQLHDPSVYMRCIAFGSPRRGWVGTITEGKTFFETHDGGANWTPVSNLPSNAPVAVCGMSVVNELVVYAAGSNHPEQPVRMMKTLDGGGSWSAWDMRAWADNLIDVFFTSADRGWVVGGRTDDRIDPAKPKLRPVVLYTEDGGRTWEDRVETMRSEFPLGEWGWKIQFLSDQIGFISLQNYDAGAILTTTDGGKTWARRPINDAQKNANLEGIGFIDAKVGWVGGWGDAPKQKRTSSGTSDGGLTWRDANEIGRTINRFRFLGNPVTVGYAAGETIYKYSATAKGAAKVAVQEPLKVEPQLFDSLLPITGIASLTLKVFVPEGTARFAMRIFNPDGPLVRTLVDESNPEPGERTLTWARTDHSGNSLPMHSYICRVTCDELSESRLVYISNS